MFEKLTNMRKMLQDVNDVLDKKFQISSLTSQYFFWTLYSVFVTLIFLFFQYETLMTNTVANPLLYVLLRLLNFLSFFSIIYSLNNIFNKDNKIRLLI